MTFLSTVNIPQDIEDKCLSSVFRHLATYAKLFQSPQKSEQGAKTAEKRRVFTSTRHKLNVSPLQHE